MLLGVWYGVGGGSWCGLLQWSVAIVVAGCLWNFSCCFQCEIGGGAVSLGRHSVLQSGGSRPHEHDGRGYVCIVIQHV